jgi:hypothetical protein
MGHMIESNPGQSLGCGIPYGNDVAPVVQVAVHVAHKDADVWMRSLHGLYTLGRRNERQYPNVRASRLGNTGEGVNLIGRAPLSLDNTCSQWVTLGNMKRLLIRYKKQSRHL